ncbi:acyl-CoA oxidase [Lentzea tibetensis]|uniref:Acyl-CoA oxidase n=1 Tax=Lentzea tibetensis TaxID=2591470 RepID=A0A563EJD3_9PSEU|nr:acyl-CoA dehydrogenase [Lentzea tibetensis]TWP46860.1 acyl-CoA oxidase [Lentzea tibetensis]
MLHALQDLLFDSRFDDLHHPWVKVFCGDVFRYRDGLSLVERAELGYRRVRAINGEIASAEELASDPERLIALHEWAGFVDGTLASQANIHYNLFLGSVLDLDRERTVDLAPFAALERYGTILITETGFGNNAADLETTATYQHETGTFDLHTPSPRARKFMPNAGATGGPKSGLVAARLVVRGEDCGVFLFLVPLTGTPGVTVDPMPEKPGFALDNSITSFEHVTLPRSAFLGGDHGTLTEDGEFRSTIANRRRRFLRSVQRVTAGKLCLSAAGAGAMRGAVAIAIRYAHQRQTFASTGKGTVPIFDYRCNQTRLLGALATAYAGTALLRSATRRLVGRGESDALEVDNLISVAKGWLTWRTREVLIECRERCGAQGLLSVNRIVDALLPTEGAITAEGDNLVIWSKAGADMLIGRGYRPPTVDTAVISLQDNDSLLALLMWHERYRHRFARTRLRRPASNRWNNAVNPALDLVDAHATRLAAQSLLTAARGTTGTARAALDLTFRLFALQRLAPHTGVLLAEGHLTADQVRGLAAEIDAVAEQLAPHALTMVDAFAIPDDLLQAPIAG